MSGQLAGMCAGSQPGCCPEGPLQAGHVTIPTSLPPQNEIEGASPPLAPPRISRDINHYPDKWIKLSLNTL